MIDQLTWGAGVAVVLFVMWRAHERVLPHHQWPPQEMYNQMSASSRKRIDKLETQVKEMQAVIDGLCVQTYMLENPINEDAKYSIYAIRSPASQHGRLMVRKAEGDYKLSVLEAERKRVLEDYPVEPPKVKP